MNLLPVILLAATPTAASNAPKAQVQLEIFTGQTGEGRPDQPALSWENDVLYVQAVTSMTATTEVRAGNPGISVSGTALTLCYREKIITPPPGQMIPHWARPVLLKFVIHGLPRQDYQVTVTACS